MKPKTTVEPSDEDKNPEQIVELSYEDKNPEPQ